MAQVFGEILQFKQFYGINNVVTIPTKITTITIAVTIVVFKTIQHNMLQHYFQYLVLVQTPNKQHYAILQILLHFMYLKIWQQYSMKYNQISMLNISKIYNLKIQVKYVNEIIFYELDNSLYYIITDVIGYLLNHFDIKMNMHMNFILNMGTICCLPQRSNSAIETQWIISEFNDIGYI